MSITLHLSPYVETYLQEEAAKQETPVEEYAAALIEDLVPKPPMKTGADVVAHWQENGLVGIWADRKDIGDSAEYARQLRHDAETRSRD